MSDVSADHWKATQKALRIAKKLQQDKKSSSSSSNNKNNNSNRFML